MLVKMNDLPKPQQPQSDDPEFWGVWVGRDEEGQAIARGTGWDRIAQDWQAGPTGAESDGGSDES